MDPRWRIGPADFDDPQVHALLKLHLDAMRRWSPPGSVHALDTPSLKMPDIALFTLYEDDTLVAMGALKATGDGTGEIKSMRTRPDHLGRGAGRAMLEHLLVEGGRRRFSRISLETGSGEAFEPALNLYRRRGFRNGPAFGGYTATAFNQFLHLDLAPG
jgi:putative acetyltransferase